MSRHFILVFLYLGSCVRHHPHTVYIDPAFTAYVNEFQDDGHLVINDLDMEFTTEFSINLFGRCDHTEDLSPFIRINVTTWQSFSYIQRKALVFHELGHCILNRGHDNTVLSNGMPESLMYPYLLNNGAVYLVNWPYYVQELFTRK